MGKRPDATVVEVQAVLDNMGMASRRRLETREVTPNDNPEFLLHALLSQEVLENSIAYKILQALITFMKDGLLEHSGQLIFETIEEMITQSSNPNITPKVKTALQEISTGLFSHACSILQGNAHLTVQYLQYLLNAMLREGTPRWNAYSCCGPLLMTRLESFQPFAKKLLQVMLAFPETLSVIHDLYQIAPSAFVESMPILVKLYESNFNGQLSILDIVRDLAKQNPEVVAPHLAALLQIATGAGNDDVVVVKEIETTCAHVVAENEPVRTESQSSEPEDFDERAKYCNEIASETRDLPALREFLHKNVDNAARYLRHVGQVMPLPYGIDCTKSKAVDDPEEVLDSITLQFKCAADGPRCMTHKTPITLISDSPSSWIKLFVILQAKAPTESVLDLRFRPARDVYPKPDILDKLLEIARATKGEGPDSGEEGFAILKRPFLDTDDLTDLLIDLRADGILSSFHYDVSANVWTCSECSVSSEHGVQKANVSGYLIKKGRRTGREVKRYYMLDEAHLFYATKEQKNNKPRRRIPVADILSVKETPGNVFEITIKKQKRTIILKATSQDELQKWTKAIEAVITAPK